MKKRVLSMFMALALCLTLLPTAALADELGSVDGASTVETADSGSTPAAGETGGETEAEPDAEANADAEAEAKAKAEAEAEEKAEAKAKTGAEAVAAVQAMIGELPSLGELKGMDSDTLNEAYMAVQSAYDAYEALSEEQQAQVTGADRFEELFGWFNSQVVPLDDIQINPDGVNANGDIIPDTSFARGGPLLTGTETTLSGQYYVVQGTVTIDGDLTVDGSQEGGLVLCQDAKLTINGALIHTGGDKFYIYGQSNNGADTGELIINNSNGDGAAIWTASTYDARLGINSGKVTVISGISKELIGDHITLYSTKAIHEGILDGEAKLPSEWGNSSISGGKLVLEYCGHDHAAYTPSGDTHHKKSCAQCGFNTGSSPKIADCGSDGFDRYVSVDDTNHRQKCPCGNTFGEKIEHMIETVPTNDGKKHTSMCRICGYTPESGTETEHSYDKNGECTVCHFQPILQGANGNLYDDLATALDEGETALTLVSYATGDANKGIVKTNLEFDRNATITLDMGGCTLETSTGGATITVASGTLTVKGEATIKQTGGAESASSAVRVTGGTLIFEGNLTATGASGKPAVEVTNGTLRLKAGDVLNGGVSVEGSENYETVNALLGENLAFAKVGETSTIVKGNVKSIIGNVTVVAHTHSIEEGQSACACGRQFEASVTAEDGTTAYYGTLDEAFASVKADGTVKLMIDSDDRDQDYIYVVGGPYTFDLNGHRVGHRRGDDFNQAFLQVGDPDGTPGTLTVLDSSKTDDTEGTGYFYELKLYNGSLTVESGSFYRYWESATTATGTMTFKGGTVDEFYATSANVETKLYGGTFGNVYNNIGGKPGDLLADNRAFFNRGNNSFVNGYDYQAVNDVVVKNHTHNIVDGSCECGFTCAHDWSDKNGVCKKANCGYHCPHNAGAAEADGVWACNTCGQTVTAMVTAPGGAITYYADGHLDNGNVKSGLYFAIKAAAPGSTVAALGGKDSGGYVTGGKTLTLDMSNGKTIDGMLYVGEKDTGNKLIVIGGTEISYVIVAPGNTLDLTGWTGRIGFLTVRNGGKAMLNGGTFAKLYLDSAAAGSLLASGYAFQNADTGAYVEYSSTADMENVKVVKCPHSGVTLKEDHTGAECKYCGASFAATLDDAPYGTIDAAVTDWLKNGGTLKLYADYTAATEKATWTIVSGEHSIDLNGHMMSVQGDGSAFKPTNNMHLTVTDGTEVGQITNILLDGSQRGSFTLENGFVGNLKMTGGAVVALKGGSVDNLDVQDCSENTNLSIQGGSLGKLNIKDWADGMHVSATGGSLGGYTLPSGKILADVLDHQYYAEGTSLDKQVDTAQPVEKFVIKQAPYDFGSTSKAANVPINGSIPFRVDSPSENVGVYDVKWYRRTTSGAEHMVQNRVAGVNVGDKLDVFCVITGLDRPGGAMQWQVAVKDYTINVVPAKLNDDRTVIRQKPGTGNTRNPADNRLVVTPFSSNAFNNVEYQFEVTYNGQLLELNKDYTIKDSSNRARNAGTHTLTIEGMGNYTGKKSVTWTLEPYELSAENLCHTQISKAYDGTDAVTDSTNGIDGLDGFILDSKNPRNPILSTVDVFNLGKSDYQLSNMKFDSAEAGDRTFTGTMTLTSGGNFVFAGGSRVMQIEYGSSGSVAVFIGSASIAAPAAKALQVANNHAAMYTVDLSALLPALEAPREYGAVTYELGTDAISFTTAGYYDATKGNAEVKGDKLILPIQAVKTDTTGNIGSVEVKVSTTNYHDITLTINVFAKNKLAPVMDGKITASKIAYGQALSDSSITGKMKDPNTGDEVKGTFTWTDDTIKPDANDRYEAEWKFTPTDKAAYTETTGIATVKVDKAQQYGKVSMAGYTYGQTPSTPTLTDRTGDPYAQVTYYYSSVGNGNMQVWSINDPPALNAGTYRMSAKIGETNNYYEYNAEFCEFVVAKATPTYTAPTGLTAKYGQTLEDVTLPDGWSWMDSKESVGDASAAAKPFKAKFTPMDTANYNTVKNIELEVTVNKADGGNLKTVELAQKYTDTSERAYVPDWSGLPTGQNWSYNSEYSVSTGSVATLTKQDVAAANGKLTYVISGGKTGEKITITLKASCDNYEDFTITLVITLTAKDDQAPLTLTGGTTVVYGQTLQLGTSGGSGTGAVTYAVTNGTGEATIDAATGKLTPTKVGTITVTATKAADANFNPVTSAPVTITITKATPTGEPAYTKITASGKTLADAALGIGTITPAGGTIAWDDPTTTEVVANKSYGWTYTPTDTNYTTLTGSIQLWHKSTSSGGGSYYAPTVPDMPMLYRGCTGDAVKTLQEKLNAKGFDSGNVDGIFGAKTYAAATAFQKANGLGVDGIVGKLTWAKLYDATPVNVTPVTTQPMLRTGSRGDAVRKLQELLNAKGYTCGSVDGIFGSKTYAAVLAFQKANGLAADGIVGPLTWGKLG